MTATRTPEQLNRQAIAAAQLRRGHFAWGTVALVFVLVLWGLGDVLMPFLLGMGIAYLLDPVADRLERSGLSRVWAVTLITLVVIFALMAALSFCAAAQADPVDG